MSRADQCFKRNSYDSAFFLYQKTAQSSLNLSYWDRWFHSVNGMIDCYRAKGDVNKALELVNESDSLASRFSKPGSTISAGLRHKKAIIYSEKGEYGISNQLFLEALALKSKIHSERDTTLAIIYNGMGTNFLYLGKREEALLYYMKALRNYDTLRLQNNSDYAMFSQNAGIIYAVTGDYDKARLQFDRSLAINKSILDKNDPELALVYLNLGRFFSLTGDDEKGLELLGQSLEIFKLKDSKSSKVASIYLNMGSIFVKKANYEKALSYYNKAMAIIQSSSSGKQPDKQIALLNLGFIYEKKGDYKAAENYYKEGQKLGDNLETSVKILRGLAKVNYLQKNMELAKDYYEQAERKSLELYGPDHPETALTYLKYGEFCSVENKPNALMLYEKALEIYKKTYGEKNIELGYAYNYIARYYERNGQLKQALTYYQKALIAGFRNFNNTDLFSNPVPVKNELSYNQLNMEAGKASALYSLYNQDHTLNQYLEASAEAYSLAVDMIEILRSGYQEEDSKLMISANEKDTFLKALQTQLELYLKSGKREYLEKAFTYAEKGKSSLLLSYLRDLEAKDLGKISGSYKKLDNDLKTEIAFYGKLLFDESSKRNADQSKIALWNSRMFELSRQHDSLIGIIEKEYPAYYNLKYDNSVISMKEASRNLTEKQALVEYTLADTILYIFVITHSDSHLFVSPLDKNFFSNLNTIRNLLTGKTFNNYSAEDFNLFTQAAYPLYRTLLEPANSLIEGKDLIVVPDAELGYLSFDILLTSPPGPAHKGYRGLPYLLKKVPISYAPSATALFEGFKNQSRQENHRVLAFAPSYGGEKTRGNASRNAGLPGKEILRPIPGAQTEVKNLKEMLNSDVYSGAEASESNFKNIAGNYSILHLAMHTIINNDNPLYSKLVFYRDPDKSEDGMLNTYELFGMQLNADLAVLSACNTGTGKLEQGEGIMSLSRGFFYAGVPSIIMTSWAVEDQPGAGLMTSFYKYLSEGKPKNRALQLAKLDYLETSDQLKSHPHFWAAYMNIGDISPVKDLKHPLSGMAILGICLLTALMVGAVILIIRKKQKQPGIV